jgi:hypothetical protein
MQSPILMTGAFALLMAATAATPPAPCSACDRQVSLDQAHASCLEKRLGRYLEGAQDPILISVASCDGAEVSTRLDVPQLIPSFRAQRADAPLAFLLSRSDAVCLLERLKGRSRKARRFEADLSTCQ